MAVAVVDWREMKLLRPVIFLAALAISLRSAEAPPKVTLPPAAKSLDELRTQIEAHIGQPRFSGALWGVKIASLDSKQTLFESHADRLLSPASNSKLYTSALVLDQLGGDYRIVTPIFSTLRPD